MFPIIFNEAIPIKSKKLALLIFTTPALFEDRRNSSIKSIKNINIISDINVKIKYINKSLVKYL